MPAFLAIAFLIAASGAEPAAAISGGPAVVSSPAPVYPVVARKAHMTGYAVVEGTVREDGVLDSCVAYGTNPLIAAAGEKAARGFLFSKAEEPGLRCVTLVFRFRLEGPDADDGATDIAPVTPHTFDVVGHPFPVVVTVLVDPASQPCFVRSEPGSTKFCEEALRVLPVH